MVLVMTQAAEPIFIPLKYMQKFVWQTREDTITVINTRCNQRMYENSSTVSYKG